MEERQELDERKIRELFRQTGESIQAILDYFRLKNKVLWEGAAWTSGAKTIPGISKYQGIRVYPWENREGIELERYNSTTFGGEHMVHHISSDTRVHTSVGVYLSLDGDNATIGYLNYVAHVGGGSHGTAGAAQIIKVVGTEPLLPDSLKKTAGGGVVHKLLSPLDCRGCAA